MRRLLVVAIRHETTLLHRLASDMRADIFHALVVQCVRGLDDERESRHR